MASAPSAPFLDGQAMMYINFTLMVQTFFFGGYSVLILLSTRMLLCVWKRECSFSHCRANRKRGLKTQSLKAVFIVGLFMYILSAAFWAYSIADVISRIQAYIDPKNTQWSRFYNQVTTPFNLFNAIVLINFVLSDGIVAWRAWVISRRDYRRFIVVPVAFWIVTIVSTVALIVLRIYDVSTHERIHNNNTFVKAISVLQLQNMATSLLSNISATGLIGATAWRHRQAIKASLHERSKVNQVLALLIESGVLYCFTGVIGVVSQLIRLPRGTLNDLCLSDNIQFAGAYAPAVLLLISSHKSSDDTEFLGTLPISAHRQVAPSEVQHTRHVSAIHFAVNSSVDNEASELEVISGAEAAQLEGNIAEKII
ncbi:hypothetical protein B0H19DRAFT_79945 [Mycena capillaripes]|nr:hypothetical protein B0H19DRAFT_79945 [Mycena capillaripes]